MFFFVLVQRLFPSFSPKDRGLYPSDRASAANSNIAAIVTEYCSQLDQESVLRADSVQKTSFPSAKTSRR